MPSIFYSELSGRKPSLMEGSSMKTKNLLRYFEWRQVVMQTT